MSLKELLINKRHLKPRFNHEIQKGFIKIRLCPDGGMPIKFSAIQYLIRK